MTPSKNGRALRGLKVLIVEDESIVAMWLEDLLLDLGCRVVGPASRVEQAERLIETVPIDIAVLDINIAGQLVFPVADRLRAADIPYVFATGYGAVGLIEPHQDRVVIQKPYTIEALHRALMNARAHSVAR